MKTDYEFLTTEIDGHVLTVTINRPDVMNALHPPAHAEFDEVWNEFEKDENLWVGIITGAGDRAFSAGNDLKFQMKEVLETTTLSHLSTSLINAQSHFTISEEDVIFMDISN